MQSVYSPNTRRRIVFHGLKNYICKAFTVVCKENILLLMSFGDMFKATLTYISQCLQTNAASMHEWKLEYSRMEGILWLLTANSWLNKAKILQQIFRWYCQKNNKLTRHNAPLQQCISKNVSTFVSKDNKLTSQRFSYMSTLNGNLLKFNYFTSFLSRNIQSH